MNLNSIGLRQSNQYSLPNSNGNTISNNAHLLKNQHYFNVKSNESGRNIIKEGSSTGIQVHQYDAIPTNRKEGMHFIESDQTTIV